MTGRPDTRQAPPPHAVGDGNPTGGRLGELARFLAVAVAGLAVDLGVAWTLAEPLGIPLGLAAAAGFAVAAAVNYFLHETWTFRAGVRKVSARRAIKYLLVLALTLAVRLLTLMVLVRVFPPEGWTLPMLGVATGVSFTVNFAASKFLVFGAPAPPAATPRTTPQQTGRPK